LVNRTGEPNGIAVFAGEPNHAAEVSHNNLPKSYVCCSPCNYNEKLCGYTEISSSRQYAVVAGQYLCVWMAGRRGRVYDLNAFVMLNFAEIALLKKDHPLHQLIDLADTVTKMSVWIELAAAKREAKAAAKARRAQSV